MLELIITGVSSPAVIISVLWKYQLNFIINGFWFNSWKLIYTCKLSLTEPWLSCSKYKVGLAEAKTKMQYSQDLKLLIFEWQVITQVCDNCQTQPKTSENLIETNINEQLALTEVLSYCLRDNTILQSLKLDIKHTFLILTHTSLDWAITSCLSSSPASTQY